MGRNERGAVLVETAIVAPLLLLIICGTVEWGFVFRDSLTVANGARAGARAAASAGSDPLADLRVIRAVEGATGTLSRVSKIVVFKASSATSTVPSVCFASDSGVDGLCNVYTADDIANLDNASGDGGDDASGEFQDPTYNLDDHWPATSRVTSVRSSKGPDWVGIWVSAPHDPVMSSLLGRRTLTDCVVMRLEPTV